MADGLAGRASIVGVGESPIGNVGLSALGLMAVAAREALDDAGLTKNDIDAVLATESYVKPYNRLGSQFGEYFGLPKGVRYQESLSSGSGLAGGYGVHYAAAFVAAGLCDTVMVVMGDNLLSNTSRDVAVQTISENYEREFGIPYGPIVATRYAWMAQQYMAQYGVTREQLSAVAVSARSGPRSTRRRSSASHSTSRASPPRRSSRRPCTCSTARSSPTAAPRSSSRAARTCPTRRAPVAVTGVGASFGNGEFAYDDITNLPDLVDQGQGLAAERAFSMAGMTADDIDLAYIYDCFSIMVLIELEGLGLCGRGEAAKFVAEGGIAPGGALPTNTHGGLLSFAHPAKPGGLFMFTEAVLQLRGEAGERQVADAGSAMVKGHMAHCAGHPVTILTHGANA